MIRKSRLWLVLMIIAALSAAVAIIGPPRGTVYAVAPNTSISAVANPVTFTEASTTNTFSVHVINESLSTPATSAGGDFIVSSALPAGFTVNGPLSGGGSSGFTCASGTTLTCTHTGALPANYNDTFTITLTVTKPALVSGNFSVSLTQANNGETDSFDNTYVQNYTVDTKPDLTISRFFHQGNGVTTGSNFAVGSSGTFTATIRNVGNSATTTPVQLDFQLPTAANFALNTTTTSTGFACSDMGGGLIRCTRSSPAIDIGAGNQVDVTIQVTPSAAMAATNASATVSGGGEPSAYVDAQNGPITDSVTVVGAPNLRVTKSHTPTDFTAGANGTYTFVVTNTAGAGVGPTIAPVVLSDALPGGMTYVNTVSSGNFNCSASSGSNISCTRSTIMAPADSDTIIITVAVPASIPATTPVTNFVTVTSTGQASNGFNTNVADVTNIRYVEVQFVSKVPYYAGSNTTFVADSTNTLNQGFTFTIKNNGTGPTVNTITLNDTLPTGLLVDSITPVSGPLTWSCPGAVGTNTLTCTNTVGVLAASGGADTSVFSVKVRVGPTAYPSATNTATVTNTPDADGGNNSASSGAVAVKAAQLQITKTHTLDFQAGQPGDYTIIVTNNGDAPAPANTITVVDTMPAGFSAPTRQSGGPDWGLPTGSGPYTFAYGPALAPGASSTPLVIRTTPTSQSSGVINSVQVNSPDDRDNSNNTASDTTVVNAPNSPDLELTKTITTPFVQGTPGVYRLTLRNIGTADASGVITVSDTLPSGPGFTGITAVASHFAGSGTAAFTCSVAAPVVTCSSPTGTITAADEYRFTITATAANAGGPGGAFINQASLTSAPGDTNPSNNNPQIGTTVAPAPIPDLTISKTHHGNFFPGAPADSAFVDITVSNVGGANTSGVTGVTVTDTLPQGIHYNSGATGSWTCTITSAPNAYLTTGEILSCTLPAAVVIPGANYAALSIPLNVMNPPITTQVTAVNTAFIPNSAPGSGGETNFANNTATDQITITTAAAPDLSIAKSHTGNFTSGINGTYTLTVRNVGSGASNAGETISVTDTLPAGLTYVSGTSSNGFVCPAAPALPATQNPVTCTRSGSMAANETATITITVMPNANGTITNSVAVSGLSNDANAGNNSATDPTFVNGAPDLSITKSHLPTNFVANVPGTYTITVTNSGSASTASGSTITVTDVISNELNYTGSSSSTFGCSYNSGSRTLTCTRLTVMAPTNTATITVNVTPIATGTFPKSFPNTATVSITPAADNNNTNDTATDQTTVTDTAVADLQLTKSHTADFVLGDTAGGTYTLTVTNVGSAAFSGPITVVDTLPAPNLTYRSFTSVGPSTWSCVNASNTVTCTTTTTLNNGNSTAFSITTNVIGPIGTVTNNANITVGATGDPTTTNNSANNGAGDPTNIVTVPPISSGNSSISATPQTLFANNTDATTVTVIVRDTNNVGMNGKTVTLNPSSNLSGGLTVVGGNTATTNASGVATFQVRSSQTGTVSFTATVDAQTIQNTAATTVTFQSTTGLNTGNSSMDASPTTLALNATSTVTVHVRNNLNGPVVGAGVTLTYTTNTGNSTGISPASGATATTNSSGDATFSLTSSTNQTVTLTATASFNAQTITLTQHPVVTFGSGGTSSTVTTDVTTDCTSIGADNIQVANITVTMKNADNTGVSGKTFTLAGNPVLSGMSIQATQPVTDTSGIAKFTVRSTSQGGPVTFTATNTTDSAVVSKTVQVTFTAPTTKCVAAPTATATPGATGTPSDGTVITALLCIRTGPGFGYSRYAQALKFRTEVRVLGRANRIPGLGVKDNCIHRGGPTWYEIQLANGAIVWANANYIRLSSRLNFAKLPVIPAPPAPGTAGAPPSGGIVGQPVAATATPKP